MRRHDCRLSQVDKFKSKKDQRFIEDSENIIHESVSVDDVGSDLKNPVNLSKVV